MDKCYCHWRICKGILKNEKYYENDGRCAYITTSHIEKEKKFVQKINIILMKRGLL